MPKLARFTGKKGDLVVHHINGNDDDNRPENLLLCSRSKQVELRAQLEHLAFQLVNEGKIVLKDGEYRRNFPPDPPSDEPDHAEPVEDAEQDEQADDEHTSE